MEKDRRKIIFNSFGILSSLFILLSGRIVPQTPADLLVQVFGILLIVWSVIAIKVNKTKQPHHLLKGYFFLNKGPYEILRHPIYAGYLLIMISIVEVEFTFLRLIALLILCMCVMFKIIREEYITLHAVKEYKEYKAKTKALIPYLL